MDQVDDMEDETRDPITFEVMTDPVMTEEGFTYERKSIEAWFEKKGTVSPTTGVTLANKSLTPNLSIRNLITRRHPDVHLVPLSSNAKAQCSGQVAEHEQGEDKSKSTWKFGWPRWENSVWKDWGHFNGGKKQNDNAKPSVQPNADEGSREILMIALSSLQQASNRNSRPYGAPGSDVAHLPAGDLYRVLDVDHSSSQKEIKDAYYRVAREWHPDKTNRPDAEERFKGISEAYFVLGDEARRRDYDARLAGGDAVPGIGVVQVEAFLRTLFGAGEFELVFGDPTSLPALQQILRMMEAEAGPGSANISEVDAEAMRREEARVCEGLSWKLLGVLERRTTGQLDKEAFGRWAREWAKRLLEAPGGMDLLKMVGFAYRHKARKFAQKLWGLDMLLTEGKDVMARISDGSTLVFEAVRCSYLAQTLAEKAARAAEQGAPPVAGPAAAAAAAAAAKGGSGGGGAGGGGGDGSSGAGGGDGGERGEEAAAHLLLVPPA